MEKITFVDNVTKANAETFNTMQDNIENAINDTIEYIDEKSLDIYSSNEVRIGTWINNKPLYRKVVDTGQISSASKTVAHNISNMNICTNLIGIAYFNNNTFYILPRVGTTSLNHQCTLYCNRTNIYLQPGSDCNFDGSFVIIEYTKTTD